jgi:hypothetical protein
MSSESMPVLSRAIINFEMFMTEWEKLGKQHRILRPWTQIGLRWATKYYIRMDDTEVYVISMCKFEHHCSAADADLNSTVLNPSIRFSWIEAQWEPKYIQSSREIILKRVSCVLILYTRMLAGSRADGPLPRPQFVDDCDRGT